MRASHRRGPTAQAASAVTVSPAERKPLLYPFALSSRSQESPGGRCLQGFVSWCSWLPTTVSPAWTIPVQETMTVTQPQQ
jgi:hypothetical protein